MYRNKKALTRRAKQKTEPPENQAVPNKMKSKWFFFGGSRKISRKRLIRFGWGETGDRPVPPKRKIRKTHFAKRNLQPATAVALHDWKNPVAPSERPLIFGFIQMADGQLTQRGWRDSQEETICLTININFNYKEYTYALACTRKIDVSCGLRVAHTSYDNDKRNLQPATAVTFRFEELGILFA